ncbi:MAG TPA: DUF1993 domain-containing protein [Caulobacteraceae bacterium]
MPISMFQASVPVLTRGLRSLSAILEKAMASAEARKIDPTVLVGARLSPDMFSLGRQVQIASDTAKGAAARLAAVEVPSWPDTETNFAELQARIAKTIDYLATFKAEQMDGAEDRAITLKTAEGDIAGTGQSFLLNFALPNFFFHLATAYGILRHNGVAVGKRDFLGAP